VNELESVTVTPHLLLITIPEERLAEDNRGDPSLVHHHPFDPIR